MPGPKKITLRACVESGDTLILFHCVNPAGNCWHSAEIPIAEVVARCHVELRLDQIPARVVAVDRANSLTFARGIPA